MRRNLLTLLLAAASYASSSQASVVNFEDVALATGSVESRASLVSGGYLFMPSDAGNGLQLANEAARFAASGSTRVGVSGSNNVLTMSRVGGGAFGLSGVWLGEYFLQDDTRNAISVEVIGSLVGGGEISTSFTLDGWVDGPGGDVDYEGFSFGAGWGELLSVSFSGFGGEEQAWSLDDISVLEDSNSVPEPASLALVALALAGLAVGRRRDSAGR